MTRYDSYDDEADDHEDEIESAPSRAWIVAFVMVLLLAIACGVGAVVQYRINASRLAEAEARRAAQEAKAAADFEQLKAALKGFR